MAIIEVNNLKKEYRINKKKEGLTGAFINIFNPKYETKVAIDGISFSIDEGELVGYIGANGAGKSTTIKMLTGILTPTSGNAIVNGLVPYKSRIKNNMNIGVVFGQRIQLWWDTPVIESYKLIQKIYEVPDNVYNKNLQMYTELLDLKDLLGVPVRQLSLGQKMRCEIAAAFIHEPRIVFLDEPTIGLDIMVKDKIREFIKELNRQKKVTVFLTTHDMQDIEEICNRVIIIDYGKIIYDGSLDEVKNQFGNCRIIKLNVRSIKEGLEEAIEGENGKVSLMHKDGHELQIKFRGNEITASSVLELVSPHCDILDLAIEEPSIESIVKDLFRK